MYQIPGALALIIVSSSSSDSTSPIRDPGAAELCSVLLVTYNSAAHIGAALESVLAAPQVARVIVLDNGSADATVEIVQRYPGVSYLQLGDNLGYAAAINVGRRLLPADQPLLILNPDLIVMEGAVASLLRALTATGAGVVVPMILDSEGDLYPSIRYEPSILRAAGDAVFGSRFRARPRWLSETAWRAEAYVGRAPMDWATGAALMVTPVCNRAVGDWDESFFLYSEETDTCRRARRAGFALIFEPAAQVRHYGRGSGGSVALSTLMAVNRVRYFEKHHRPIASLVFRAIVVAHHAARALNAGHRHIAATLLNRASWPSLVTELRTDGPAGSRRSDTMPLIPLRISRAV
jgi:GT2 family glycosyltransferase